jgi:hypothetical protein
MQILLGDVMPRGPKGEKRPAEVIGNAVQVMRIATEEIEENARDSGWIERYTLVNDRSGGND